MGWCALVWSGSGQGQVNSSCERGNESYDSVIFCGKGNDYNRWPLKSKQV
jgi:hypothetical protein